MYQAIELSSTTLLGMFTVIDAMLCLPLSEDGGRFCNRYLFGERFKSKFTCRLSR